MIQSILLVDDEDLFHLVFEDACSLLDMTLSLEALNSSDEADKLFKQWFEGEDTADRPECVFVDLNIIGSSFDGIELIEKINTDYGNGVVKVLSLRQTTTRKLKKPRALVLSSGLSRAMI